MDIENEEYKRVRREIYSYSQPIGCEMCSKGDYRDCPDRWEVVDQILDIEGIAILSDDQDHEADKRWRSLGASIFTQQDMLKANFRRVI